MSTITYLNRTVSIRADLPFEDYELLSRFNPKALTVYDENKEPVFTVNTTTRGMGTPSKFGFILAKDTAKNADGKHYASVTFNVPDNVDDVKTYVVDNFGDVIVKFNELEKTVAKEVVNTRAARQRLMDSMHEAH